MCALDAVGLGAVVVGDVCAHIPLFVEAVCETVFRVLCIMVQNSLRVFPENVSPM